MRFVPSPTQLIAIPRRFRVGTTVIKRNLSSHSPACSQGSRRQRIMAAYSDWSRDDLLVRIAGLEALLGGKNGGLTKPERPAGSAADNAPRDVSTSNKGKQKREARPFDVSSQPCRKIAVRFSYDGAHYSGLAAQSPSAYSTASASAATPLPTVEGVLWNALAQCRLVDDAAGFDGAGWSRCGRTDRGVSAAGQVVALWVRSRRVDERHLRQREDEIRRRKWEAGQRDEDVEVDGEVEGAITSGADAAAAAMKAAIAIEAELGPRQPPILINADVDELPYVAALNRVLPSTIRVHAWSPVRSDFSARFDCRYRHYKYFFTAGAPPSLRPSTLDDVATGAGPRLDIGAMRDAARRLLGSHDFRNLCKLDSSKQVTNFVRRVDGVSIDIVPHGHWPTSAESSARLSTIGAGSDEEDWSTEHMYVFNLRGTAFLYHQVRHIMAILFLVGARLESPTIVDELINVETGRARRDRLVVDALRRQVLEQGSVLGDTGRKSIRDWIEWCLPNSSATDSDGHTANTRPGGPKSDASITTMPTVDAALAEPDADDDKLAVMSTKPMYEMASDRPLVLWECGFRPVDLSWRAGTFDEPLGDQHQLPKAVAPPPSSPTDDAGDDQPKEGDSGVAAAKAAAKRASQPPASSSPEDSNKVSSWRTTADLHSTWTGAAISAQIARHFVLAAPSPHAGTLPAWTHFLDAAVPVQPEAEGAQAAWCETRSRSEAAGGGAGQTKTQSGASVPIGNGLARPYGSYVPLVRRKRGDPVDVTNARWAAGRGSRRAAVRGLTAEELSRGMRPRITAEERAQLLEEEAKGHQP